MCNLFLYLSEGYGAQKRFVTGAPRTALEVQWLMRWDRLLFQREEEKALKLFPAGFAARYIDEIVASVNVVPTNALDRLFWIYRYSDGHYAEYVREKLEVVFRDHPRLLYEQWGTVRNHRTALTGISYSINFENPANAKRLVTEACGADTNGDICREIRETFLRKEK